MAGEYVKASDCKARTDKILEAIEALNSRLYHDNGRVSIQTRLDRHERVLAGFCRAVSIIGGAFLVTLVGVFWKLILIGSAL